ncbi:MAG: hypothetical protein K9M84_10845 [Spirochaetia bacterium]|nr:hypothetical protein [Spirochaetia bacterium]
MVRCKSITNQECVLEHKSEKKQQVLTFTAGDQVTIGNRQRKPVQNGIIWSQPVAQFILDIYPDILESDMDMKDLIRMINGNILL